MRQKFQMRISQSSRICEMSIVTFSLRKSISETICESFFNLFFASSITDNNDLQCQVSLKPLLQVKINFQINFIEITLRHGCSPVNLLHIFRTPFLKNTSERLVQKLPDRC